MDNNKKNERENENFMILKTKLQFNNAIDINEILSPSQIDSAKKNHSLVKVYTVAHEGESRPTVLGSSNSYVINWIKDSVKKVYDKINLGIQCIKGHTKDNNLGNEKILGKVVGKTIKTIDNILHSIVAVEFIDKNDSNYDVISMESDVDIDTTNNIVTNIYDVFRFALGNSKETQPAIPMARQITSMQFFEHEIETKPKNGGNPVEQITFNQVRDAVRALNIFPSQLYSMEDIFGKAEKKENGQVIFYGGDHKVISEINKHIPDVSIYNSKVEELNKQVEGLKAIEKEYAQIRKEKETKNLLSNIDGIFAERNLEKPKVDFLKKRLDKFIVDEPNVEKLNEFINDQLEIYKEVYQVLIPAESKQETIPTPTVNSESNLYEKGEMF
jgi:hypothetical protein